jgi:hypothetical protein
VKTIHERLEPTIKAANRDQKKYARKGEPRYIDLKQQMPTIHVLLAMMFSYSLNIAIGLQVVVGSMITGLSAIFEGHKVSTYRLVGCDNQWTVDDVLPQVSIMTSVLGLCTRRATCGNI